MELRSFNVDLPAGRSSTRVRVNFTIPEDKYWVIVDANIVGDVAFDTFTIDDFRRLNPLNFYQPGTGLPHFVYEGSHIIEVTSTATMNAGELKVLYYELDNQ